MPTFAQVPTFEEFKDEVDTKVRNASGPLSITKGTIADLYDDLANIIAATTDSNVKVTLTRLRDSLTVMYQTIYDSVNNLSIDARPNEVVGVLYSENDFEDYTGLSTNFTGHSIEGGNIAFTSGSNTADSIMSYEMYVQLDRWDMQGKFIIDDKSSISHGFGMGVKGLAGYPGSLFARFNATDHSVSGGKLYIILGASSVRDSSALSLPFLEEDTLSFRVYYNYDDLRIVASITNLRNDSIVSVDYSGAEMLSRGFDNVNDFSYGLGKFSVFSRSATGDFTLDELVISSNTIKYADIAVLGDSKSWGARATPEYMWPKAIARVFESFNMFAGSGNWIEDLALLGPQMRLTQPKQILVNIGFNNYFSGQSADTIIARYERMMDTLTSGGSEEIVMLPQYDSKDQSALRTFQLATYPDYIDLYDITAACGAACMDGSIIHPNNRGSELIAAGILGSGKIKGRMNRIKSENSFDRLLPLFMTQTQRNAFSPIRGHTIYCTNCTATDGSTGVKQTWNGSEWKNHW